MLPIKIDKASTDEDIKQILSLQQKNLVSKLTIEQIQEQGFVTVIHDFDLLNRMNHAYPHIIAKAGEEIIGYALVMTQDFRAEIPVLEPMFEKLEHIIIDSKPISKNSFFIMGQICIAEEFRGKGIFDQLYHELHKQLCPHFEWCITEVAIRNKRSFRAHQRVGFQTLLEYQDQTDHWALIGWDWR